MASPPMINNDCHSPPSSSSLRDKLKSRFCCFLTDQHDEILDSDSDDGRRKANQAQSWTPRSTCQWLKSTAQDLEIRDRCKVLIGSRGKNRRRHGSADFSYDLASYSLNFEDDSSREDELPLNNFMARLPVTPERIPAKDWAESPRVVVSRATAPRRELVAWS